MSKFIAGHMIKMRFLKLWITSFLTQILHVNFKETVERMMWYLLQQITANLSITIKWLTRYKQKVVLATMLDSKSMSSNNGIQYKSYYFVEKIKVP